MMARFSTVFLLSGVALLFFILRGVDGCSCQPAHPQEHYCRSDFVIKALVGKARLVELGPDGEYERVHHKKQKLYVNKNDSRFSSESDGLSKTKENSTLQSGSKTDNDDANPAPFVFPVPSGLGDLKLEGPDTRMPGYNSQRPLHISEYSASRQVGNSDDIINRQRRNRLRPKKHVKKPTYYSAVGQAPGVAPGQVKPKAALMMQYRINIIKTFKGLVNVTKQKRMFIYTPPAPLCDMKLTTNRSPFVLMGNIQNGALMIKVCNHKVDMKKLTSQQSKNLLKNMQKRYPSGCESCYVKVCNMGDCNQSSYDQPFQCVWKDGRTTSTTSASQFACLETKAGKCKWYNGYDRSAKPEDIPLTGR